MKAFCVGKKHPLKPWQQVSTKDNTEVHDSPASTDSRVVVTTRRDCVRKKSLPNDVRGLIAIPSFLASKPQYQEKYIDDDKN